MRTSAAKIKGGRGKSSPLQDKPKLGTKIRTLYDYFVNNPLVPISISKIYKILNTNNTRKNRYPHWLEILLQYDLDIRLHSRKSYESFYWLVAIGDEDLMADKVKSMEIQNG
jgi:hypothetical protein